MNNIEKYYYQLIDKGISIADLYAYYLLVTDDRGLYLDSTAIKDYIKKIMGKRNKSNLSIEEALDEVLEGEDSMEDNEEWE